MNRQTFFYRAQAVLALVFETVFDRGTLLYCTVSVILVGFDKC